MRGLAFALVSLAMAASGVSPASVHASTKRPMALEDILLLREPSEPRISPDGKWIAFVTRRARLDINDYETSLEVVATSPGATRVRLSSVTALSNIRWAPNSYALYYLKHSDGNAQIMRINLADQSEKSVFSLKGLITRFEFSPDEVNVAFVTRESSSIAGTSEQSGIVFDETTHSAQTFRNGAWQSKQNQWRLWLRNLKAEKEEQVWESKRSIDDLVWSPAGSAVAVVYDAPAHPAEGGNAFNSDIAVLNTSDKSIQKVASTYWSERVPAWSPNNENLAFVITTFPAKIRKVSLKSGTTVDLTKDFPVSFSSQLKWKIDGRTVLIGNESGSQVGVHALLVPEGTVSRISSGSYHLSAFSWSANSQQMACIRQQPTSPPEIARLDLTTGSLITLTDLNPNVRDLALGDVTERRWKNKFGHETNGYLIKPVGYEPGKRYPVLIILYGFTGKFISQAEWITSFPAQAFAANGFAVLLMNQPRVIVPRVPGDFQTEQLIEAYSPVASIESILETLVQEGIADPAKRGVLGWSYGGFLVEFLLTHRNLFHAASAGECGLWDPGIYWVSSRSFREAAEKMLGGPPYGVTLKNWLEFSPAMNAARVTAPLLFEQVDRIEPLEFYTALRRHKKTVEMIIYPGEAHVFSQPKNRLASMARNLDWFNFWLKGTEDPDPAKLAQYARWRELRKLHDQNSASSSSK